MFCFIVCESIAYSLPICIALRYHNKIDVMNFGFLSPYTSRNLNSVTVKLNMGFDFFR
jgi:hypothetical protein